MRSKIGDAELRSADTRRRSRVALHTTANTASFGDVTGAIVSFVLRYSRLMASNLFRFMKYVLIATAAITSIAMATTQSVTEVATRPVEAAAKQNNLVFGIYVSLLVLLAIWTVVLWKSGNNLQEAIRANANARIEEAKALGSQANERANRLEQDNILLRTAQQKVETDLANQRERAAIAERSLLELQEKLAWRSLNTKQQERIVAKLKAFPRTPFQLRVFQEPEAIRFMNQIADILRSADWVQQPVVAAMLMTSKYGDVGMTLSSGIIVNIDTSRTAELDSAARALAAALDSEGVASEFKIITIQNQPERIHIAIGKKP